MVEVKVGENGVGDVLINGKPMPCVTGVDIVIRAGSTPKITVYADKAAIDVAAPECEVVGD